LDVNYFDKDLSLFDKCFDVFQGLNSYNEIKVNNVNVYEYDTKHYGVAFDIEEPEFKRSANFFAISDGDEIFGY